MRSHVQRGGDIMMFNVQGGGGGVFLYSKVQSIIGKSHGDPLCELTGVKTLPSRNFVGGR